MTPMKGGAELQARKAKAVSTLLGTCVAWNFVAEARRVNKTGRARKIQLRLCDVWFWGCQHESLGQELFYRNIIFAPNIFFESLCHRIIISSQCVVKTCSS